MLLLNRVKNIALKLYNATHYFSDQDAWLLYRAAAFAEAIGWTLLIGAISYRKLDMPNPDILISIAGRIHGLFFVIYFIAVLLLARSMEWKGLRIICAVAAGVPPYGSLVFEMLMAHNRRHNPPQITPPKDYDV